ncbi:hypothetical protein [Nannocystis pusilla]|uniref:hypothetical protein n=1 Tax=Nannocystis pusilla TaxID=889268 RepID=UPI003B76E89F
MLAAGLWPRASSRSPACTKIAGAWAEVVGLRRHDDPKCTTELAPLGLAASLYGLVAQADERPVVAALAKSSANGEAARTAASLRPDSRHS